MAVYDAKTAVWVVPYTGAVVKYGFLTNVLASVGTDCGHTAVGATPPVGLVYGANSPKPGRAVKKGLTGTAGSFYSIAQRATLKTAGYTTSRPTIRRGSVSASSTAVYVTLGTIKYAWRMPTRLFTLITADASALGINLATAADRDLVWGSTPRPPKAFKTTATGILSTFVDPTVIDTLPTGWSTSATEEVD